MKCMVYGDIDLNLIDGSSIWLQSVVRMLNSGNEIDAKVLLKRPIISDMLIKEIDSKFIDPFNDSKYSRSSFVRRKRMLTQDAVKVIEDYNNIYMFDFILVRGFNLAVLLTENVELISKTIVYLTDFTHNETTITELEKKKIQDIFDRSFLVACQTQEMKDYFINLFNVEKEKLIVINPMVPYVEELESFKKGKYNRLIYSGKFAEDWYTKEILNGFNILNNKGNFSLTVVGNKFNKGVNDSLFEEHVKEMLESNQYVNWIKGVPRVESLELISKADIGISWRSDNLDESLELSTKLLEYGSKGKPVVMNKTKMHVRLFGEDYPLFANNLEEFILSIDKVLRNPLLYQQAAKKVYEVAKKHTFKNIYESIINRIMKIKQRERILFAGHDMKFIERVMFEYAKMNYTVLVDKWYGHEKHDEDISFKKLNAVDTIFCEWGLGNVVWYSKNMEETQNLIVRLHAQELRTIYPEQYNYENIDKMIFVSEHTKTQFIEKYGAKSNMFVIPNYLNINDFAPNKLEDSKYNIGIVGVVPSQKGLDRAIYIFEEVKKMNNSFTLHIKGRRPEDYSWIKNNLNELQFYKDVYKKINKSLFRDSIIFDEYTKNMDEWYEKIGYILSQSDHESFHLSVAEGMAKGTIPVIRNWEGSNIYPNRFIFDKMKDMIDFILSESNVSLDDLVEDSRKKYEFSNVFNRIRSVVNG